MPTPEEMVPLVSFVPVAGRAEAIQQILDLHGIQHRVEGSRAYQVKVHARDYERALGLLIAGHIPDLHVYPRP